MTGRAGGSLLVGWPASAALSILESAEFILHTDYIFSISPDCRAPTKCINEYKTVNPGGLQYNHSADI